MGVITHGYHVADGCCTLCCMGGIVIATAIITIPLEIVSAPVLIPIRMKRNKKFSKVFQQFMEKLTEDDKMTMMDEIGKTMCAEVKHRDIKDYHTRLLKNRHNRDDMDSINGINTKKADKLPAYYKKNIVWCNMPAEDVMLEDWAIFFAEIKRQKVMTEAELMNEIMKDLRNTLTLLSKK